jgi:hypothetical protein
MEKIAMINGTMNTIEPIVITLHPDWPTTIIRGSPFRLRVDPFLFSTPFMHRRPIIADGSIY